MHKAMIHRLKPICFSQLTLLSSNLVLTSHLSGILLRIMVFLIMGRSPENNEEKKQTKKKEKKNEEYEESQIATIYTFKIMFC